MTNNNYFFSTPIYYVNSNPHIGTLYTSVVADFYARFKKLEGCKVHFLTGTDEHGQKIERAAQALNQHPQEFVNKNSQTFRSLIKTFDICTDDFIRTTEPRHKTAVSKLWELLFEKGYIYKGSYKGFYSTRDEAFYAESEIKDGLAPTGAPVEWVEEESYFFKLSVFQDKLLKLYEDNPDFIKPSSRRNEVKAFVAGGLEDLSISRSSFTWGIPVPNNPKYIIYVWIDALANYISALGWSSNDSEVYNQFWNTNQKVHIIGKDILRFHAVYWPALLMAAELPLPTTIIAHGWWLSDGQKISKSVGNTIDPFSFFGRFKNLDDKKILEYVKYFLLSSVGLESDGNYAEANLISKINSDLVHKFGNLLSRITSLVIKKFDGTVRRGNDLSSELLFLDVTRNKCFEDFCELATKYLHNQALCSLILVAAELNKFTQEYAPWNKSGSLIEGIYCALLDNFRVLAVCFRTVLTHTADQILDILGVPISSRNFSDLKLSMTEFKITEQINIFPMLEIK